MPPPLGLCIEADRGIISGILPGSQLGLKPAGCLLALAPSNRVVPNARRSRRDTVEISRTVSSWQRGLVEVNSTIGAFDGERMRFANDARCGKVQGADGWLSISGCSRTEDLRRLCNFFCSCRTQSWWDEIGGGSGAGSAVIVSILCGVQLGWPARGRAAL